MHYYAGNRENDTASYLAMSAEFESFVDTLSGVLRYVKAKNRSKKDIYLSWDEWNVWYKATLQHDVQGKWTEAPHLIEEVYNLEDALVAAQWMNVFLRKSDVLKIACLAQIVNVIAPILTTKDAMLKQSIYYPFMLFSRLASGNALDPYVRAPMYSTAQFGDMPLLDVSASYDEATGKSGVFIVNRSQTESVTVDVNWQDQAPRCINAADQLAGTDPKAANSFENPNAVVSRAIAAPVLDGSRTTFVVPPLSFTALDVSF
jgi:alpha-N-arabinofuranosidase